MSSNKTTTKIEQNNSKNNINDEVKKKKRSRKKEKKEKIEISLWVNGAKYEFGLLCTFCAKTKAVCHCPSCEDFYCEACDTTAHLTKKRKDHIRTKLSHYDLDTAAGYLTRAVRFYGHLRLLQHKCRKLIKRYFDKKTLNYYYYNTVYKTVSWKKPYCLRKQELAPYMSRDYAASKCQNLYYLWISRDKTRTELLRQYKKIFDRRNGKFYYAFNGGSRLLPKSSWVKPKLLGKRSFPKDLKPVYTVDVAALIIQRKWRAILMRQFLRAVARASFEEVWDPVKGKFNYLHKDSETLYQDKPLMFGQEPWDPNRVPDWTVERVQLFLRRIGLKQYIDKFANYNVNGNTLLLLDEEDYENMGISSRIHKKKIRVELDKIYRSKTGGPKVIMSEEHANRRERIRRQKMYNAAATLIQKNFRVFSAKRELRLRRDVKRVMEFEAINMQRIIASRIWWTQMDGLPSNELPPVKFEYADEESEEEQDEEGESLTTQRTKDGDRRLKLPPIKNFGRQKDYLSLNGWGRNKVLLRNAYNTPLPIYNSVESKDIRDSRYKDELYNGSVFDRRDRRNNEIAYDRHGTMKWMSVPTSALQNDQVYNLNGHPTRVFSEKLRVSGYDDQRKKEFKDSIS